MKTPILETERMILRPLDVADASDIYERWTSDDRVSKYVKWCTHGSVEDTIEWLKMEESNISSDKAYTWGFTLKDSGYPVSGKVMEKCGFIHEKNEIHTKFDGVTSWETKKHRLIIQ